MSTSNDDREVDPPIEHVADPDSYNQTRRLKEIHDARREFHQRKREADELKIRGDVNLRQYCDLILTAFQRYFSEIEGLMHDHSNGEFYLEEVFLGELDPIDEDGTVEFNGLLSLTGNVPTVAVEGYSINDLQRTTSNERVLVTAPESIVMRGFRYCNQFIAEAGLDAEMRDDEGDAGFDYEDLLEDGPPSGSPPDIEAAEGD